MSNKNFSMTEAKTDIKKVRNSNLELFRIILMLLIVADHYVVQSKLPEMFDYNHVTGNMIFLQFFGFAGKTVINCFMLITGYFMIKSNLTGKKILYLYLEIMFYKIVVIVFLIAADIVEPKPLMIIRKLLIFTLGVNSDYYSTVLCAYLFIPFLNLFAKNMSQKIYFRFLCLVLFIYCIISTFTIINDVWNYISWLCIMYLVGAYISMYDIQFFKKKNLNLLIGSVSVILMFISILVVDFIGSKFGFTDYRYMLQNCNKLLPFTASNSFFCFFNNIRQHRIIAKQKSTHTMKSV